MRNIKDYKARMYEIRTKLHENKIRKDLVITKTETVEEFLARGGKITYLTDVEVPVDFKKRYISTQFLKEAQEYLTSPINPREYDKFKY